MRNTTLFRKAIKKGFKLVFDDIETSPPLVFTYPIGSNVNVPASQIVIDKKITSVGYKFHGDKQVKLLEWDWLGPITIHPDHIEGGGCDKKLLSHFSKDIIKADLVVAQNGDSFDIKEINSRLNQENLKAIEWPVTLDTLKLSKKTMSPSSQKLDFRSKKYGFGGKIKQDMEDCMDVARGNINKQKLRVKYNGKDVLDLEKIFWKELDYYQLPVYVMRMLKEYIKDERPFCIKCASKRQKRYDVKKIERGTKYECLNCDYVWKARK